jgi:hypothetical protein
MITSEGRMLPVWVPAWLREQIVTPDCSQGTHPRLLWLAVRLTKCFRNLPGHAEIWLRYAAERCARPVPNDEVTRLLEWAGVAISTHRGANEERLHRITANLDEIYELAIAGPTRDELVKLSPVQLSADGRHTHTVLAEWARYAGEADPLVCFGSDCRFDTWPLSKIRTPWEHAQIVPSPMRARRGKTIDGRDSAHTKDNTGDRVMLVTEFDFVAIGSSGEPTIWAPLLERCRVQNILSLDIQAAILMHLAKSRRLWLVVFSGGKSLQGWFLCKDEKGSELRRWFDEARRFGACRSTWGKSQFVRMPDGTRDNGQRQSILYYDPL